MSAHLCGCDPEEHDHHCENYPDCVWGRIVCPRPQVGNTGMPRTGLPTSDAERKALPIFSGVLEYFPDALLEVARVSKIGNDQHNPGQPLHWAKEKSTNQKDTALRHMMDHYCFKTPRDTDGAYHLAKAAWRSLAALQRLIEQERGEP